MSVTPGRYLTPPAYAATLAVKAETVVDWIRSGELKAINVARRGTKRPRYRIAPEAIRDFEMARSTIPTMKPVRRRSKSAENIIQYF